MERAARVFARPGQRKDGVIDTWSTDADGDGQFERLTQVRGRAEPVPLRYNVLSQRYKAILGVALAQNTVVIAALKSALQRNKAGSHEDEVEGYDHDKLPEYRKAEHVGQHIHDSREGTRLYQDILRDRYFARVRKALSAQPGRLHDIERLYDQGEFQKVATLLR